MKIGVFDSGIGGEAVAASLREAYPGASVSTVDDKEHVPYGNRSREDIIRLTEHAIKPLLEAKCDIIVIACNSATAAAIETLRTTFPEQLFIGLEPMVKPAAQMTNSKIIAICATPATLSSSRYQLLKTNYAQDITILEPDCSTWARMIEDNQIDEFIIRNTIEDVQEQGADIIVLACTHYHWIRDTIEKTAAEHVTVIDPSAAIVERVKTLLQAR